MSADRMPRHRQDAKMLCSHGNLWPRAAGLNYETKMTNSLHRIWTLTICILDQKTSEKQPGNR
jgi:hypothetical protein